ncbi:MAG: DUF4136 domain-containing protein [Pseudomonadota bacterium]|nr:DUF4136 domain-containing protein [Pseudomonadota bacterium]
MNISRKNLPHLLFLLVLSLITTSCATSKFNNTEVTRFHLDEPIEDQSVSLKAGGDNSIQLTRYIKLVSAELAQIGYPVIESNSTKIFIDMFVFRGMETKARKNSPVSVGIGGSSYGSKIGLGGSVKLPIGRGPQEVYVTRLEVRFIDRDTNAAIWEGLAAKESKYPPENPDEVMRKMVKALFQDFPGQSGLSLTIEDQT